MLDGLGDALQLGPDTLAPSRAVLHDYGNVSSRWEACALACVCIKVLGGGMCAAGARYPGAVARGAARLRQRQQQVGLHVY